MSEPQSIANNEDDDSSGATVTPNWYGVLTPTISTDTPTAPTILTFNSLIIASGVTTGQHQTESAILNFDRSTFRTANLIGITVNMSSPGKSPRSSTTTPRDSLTSEDSLVAARPPISGGIVQYCLPTFFSSLRHAKGIDLENVAQYPGDKGDCYIVMTPRKSCLLRLGVLKEDKKDPGELVHPSNVHREKLVEVARTVATEIGISEDWTFRQRVGRNGGLVDDVAIFDFSTRTVAKIPCKACIGDSVLFPSPLTPPSSPVLVPAKDHDEGSMAVVAKPHHRLFVTLVGDSLVVPFWPLGTGWACAANSTAWAMETIRALGPRVEEWEETRVQRAMGAHLGMFLKRKTEFAH
ncbi:[F-actin]-monooxygenase mical1 [Dinochytrium kinnereticum]|nr:[F-actin]-monooxygenase mical1 [Dinochytrium kinnereticum]